MPDDPLGLRGDPLGLRDKPVSAAPPSPLDLQPSRASILPREIVQRTRDRLIQRSPKRASGYPDPFVDIWTILIPRILNVSVTDAGS